VEIKNQNNKLEYQQIANRQNNTSMIKGKAVLVKNSKFLSQTIYKGVGFKKKSPICSTSSIKAPKFNST
jgi:hypothetical protein